MPEPMTMTSHFPSGTSCDQYLTLGSTATTTLRVGQVSELKTQQNDGDVEAFLDSVENETRRRDALTINQMMIRLSGEEPMMWGGSIVGFGKYAYRNRSGKENTWMKIGFSPRKQSLTLYIMDGFGDYDSLLGDLGPHSTGKSCLYIKDLSKVDQEVLEDLITRSLLHIEAAIERGFEGTLPN